MCVRVRACVCARVFFCSPGTCSTPKTCAGSEPGQSGGGCLKKRRRLVGAGASMDAPPSACRRDPPSLTEEAL